MTKSSQHLTKTVDIGLAIFSVLFLVAAFFTFSKDLVVSEMRNPTLQISSFKFWSGYIPLAFLMVFLVVLFFIIRNSSNRNRWYAAFDKAAWPSFATGCLLLVLVIFSWMNSIGFILYILLLLASIFMPVLSVILFLVFFKKNSIRTKENMIFFRTISIIGFCVGCIVAPLALLTMFILT